MSTPDPEGFSLLAKIGAALAAAGTPIYWLWKALEKKADKEAVDKRFHKVEAEQILHRSYFKDVFEQIRENDQRAQDRHERLMERLPPRGD